MAFNVLIVDDSSTMRTIIKRILKMTGLPFGEVWEASNGRVGLATMRSHAVDLILADLNMPDMTGAEMINEMHKDTALAGLPVVVVSSDGDKALLDSLVQMGVKEIIRKPFVADLLKRVIERIFELKV